MPGLPDGLIAYGPDTNCTLDLCPIEWSVLQYEPSVAASGAFIGLFALSMIIHIVQGIQLRSWGYTVCMVIGCIDEMVGYGGRILLNDNPFSFAGFLIQLICITTAPIFFCAAIYVTLSRTIIYLDPSLSRFPPRLLYYVFIPFDVLSLALQAGGGATSSVAGSDSSDSNSDASDTGVDVSQAGLSLQVITLVAFCVLAGDYLVRYVRSAGRPPMTRQMKVFLTFVSLAVLFVLVRCAYRIAELKDGYNGDMIHQEGEFYALESVMIILSVFCLNVGHPDYALREERPAGGASHARSESDYEEMHKMSDRSGAQSPLPASSTAV